MIIILSALVGAGIGALTARRRGGNRLDIAQYAVGFAILFGLIGLIATTVIVRQMV